MPFKGLSKSRSAGSNLGKQIMGNYIRVAVMGPAGVGKSSIIKQFLYDNFPNDYKETVEELHRGEYDVDGVKLTLDILDTAGAYAFPAMRNLAIATSNAFILVYSVDDDDSFDKITQLRQTIIDQRETEDVPIVIVGNKTDKDIVGRAILKATAESIACIDWNNGFVEASAKNNDNIVAIFQEILRHCRIDYNLSLAVKRRRQSLPVLERTKSQTYERSTSKFGSRNSIISSLFRFSKSNEVSEKLEQSG